MRLKPRWWSLYLSLSSALELLARRGVDRNTSADLGGQYAELLCNSKKDLVTQHDHRD
jgi:hypothetical protein